MLQYDGNETAARRKRTQSVSNPEDRCYDWRGKAYFRLLHATWSKCDQDRDAQDTHPVGTCYIPNYLDDPEFRQGRHRHVVRGDKIIGPVISSILLFVKPDELKEVRRNCITFTARSDFGPRSSIENSEKSTLGSRPTCHLAKYEI